MVVMFFLSITIASCFLCAAEITQIVFAILYIFLIDIQCFTYTGTIMWSVWVTIFNIANPNLNYCRINHIFLEPKQNNMFFSHSDFLVFLMIMKLSSAKDIRSKSLAKFCFHILYYIPSLSPGYCLKMKSMSIGSKSHCLNLQ